MRAYMIDTDDLKEIALINKNVEDSIINVVIQRVQKGVVRPVLGTALYDRLLTGIDADDLNSDEIELMENYVIPLLEQLATESQSTRRRMKSEARQPAKVKTNTSRRSQSRRI